MTHDRDVERLLDAWFADGPMQVPDRAFDEAVGRVYRQRQRPAWRLRPWRFPTMSIPIKLAAVGAALLAVLLGGAVFLGGGAGPGPTPTTTPTVTPTTTPTPSATPAPTPSPAPTRHAMDVPGESTQWSVEVPAGWTGLGTWTLTKSQGYGAPNGIGIAVTSAVNVPTDPCDGIGKVSDATSPADVVAALRARNDLVVSNEVDTTLSGFPGTRVDVEVPADLTAVCGPDNLIIFAEPDGRGGYAQGPSNRFRIWILDVAGVPIAFWINGYAGTPAGDMAEAETIIESSIITP